MSFAAVTAAFANPGSGMGMSMGMGRGAMSGMHPDAGLGARMSGSDMAANMGSRMDANMVELKSELKITATQEPAWQAFTAKVALQGHAMQTLSGKGPGTAGSAPDRMAQRGDFMKQRIGNMEAMSAALKDLHAVLPPEQKAMIDQRFGQMGGRQTAHVRH